MNEITIQQQQQPTTPAKTSVFDDYDVFEKALRMADALSRTQLIPQNFQGKPEDCLIALDFSRRLGLPPTAVLPHLYVIGGRPSTSAQFMISLVNRSGVFSRIQWEESCNGEVEYFANGSKRTIKNYGAIAWFEELATGRRYQSPLVDVSFALANGWLTKNDSKWQKMPEVMCRYRSASILIKTVCPELAMGMEFAEDAEDAQNAATQPFVPAKEPEVEIVQEVVPEQVVETQSEPAVDKFAQLLERLQTATAAELAETGKEIADAGLPEEQLEELREEFKKKREEITAQKKKVAALVKSLNGKIRKASTLEELSKVRAEVDSAAIDGDLHGDFFSDVQEAYDARLEALLKENEATQTLAFFDKLNACDGTKEQRDWALGLAQTISNAESASLIESNVAAANEWLDQKYITNEMHELIVAFAKHRLETIK